MSVLNRTGVLNFTVLFLEIGLQLKKCSLIGWGMGQLIEGDFAILRNSPQLLVALEIGQSVKGGFVRY